ncbi:MAG TPA: hypothetical protein VH877_21305 [Polyangia bacterium]|jgi:hypothetical protein|nr:hypothetical protein [Polyangia bacterium]
MRPPPPKAQLFTIALLLITLVSILALRQSCAGGIAQLFQTIDTPHDAGHRD